MTGSQIREAFLRYFERNGHTRVRSSPLVPADDPTLLFTNAGMVQFKRVFLGEERRDYVRATTSQKCVRAGGKHNDLENVGRTARHHTFFEMLGNFSFGDYFKDDAVAFAWELLTKDFGLPADRLCATVFTTDDEAFDLWKRIASLPESRILRLGEKDNFWAMGDTGPCGPCSEMHFHQGDHLPCVEEASGRTCLGPACECDRWLEVWNLVFMQFNRDAAGTLTPLPKPSIDTGMGLERIAAVIQGKQSDYETDLFRPLVDRVATRVAKRYGADADHDVSMQVIADHARASAFLITDGVTPSNEWRGYVLRRIMRRAMRHGRLLGLHEPFLWEIVGAVADLMGDAYPELRSERDRVLGAVRSEEERFAETLDTGMQKIDEYVDLHVHRAAPAGGRDKAVATPPVVDGKFLFTLYDTFGFPRDLAEEILEDKGWVVSDETNAVWDMEMDAQRARARAAATFGGAQEWTVADLPATEFLGYDALTAPARILAIVVDGVRRLELTEGEEGEIILDRTPAYGESGGQQGDSGTITARDGAARILDTLKRGSGLFVHRAKVTSGGLREGDTVAVAVDTARRQGLALHHTGTHLLHAALRQVLGTHAAQAGSLVTPERLRFDFSHGHQVKDREVDEIEGIVNEKVRENLSVDPFWTDLDRALGMGAIAMFGEKYGNHVRVVKIGDFSTELCGGTHLGHTGEIGVFKVVDEGSVAAGVRRIEAVTAAPALEHIAQTGTALREAAGLLKIAPLEVPKRLQKLLEEQKVLEKRIAGLETRLAVARAEGLAATARKIKDVAVVSARVDGLDAEGLRAVVDAIRDRLGSGVVCVGGVADTKVSVVAAVTKDLTKRYHAGKLVQAVAQVVGGGGGGRPDLAQAGGKDPARLDEALDLVYDLIARA